MHLIQYRLEVSSKLTSPIVESQNQCTMKTIQILTPVFFVTLLVFGCQKDATLTDVAQLKHRQMEHRINHPVPFRASFISTVLVFPPDPNVEECGFGPPVLNLRQTLEGHATHMGVISGSISSCINFATGMFVGARMTLIAANGDELYLELSDEPVPVPPLDIAGGTGRFLYATGRVMGSFELISELPTPTFQNDLEGHILYPRSNMAQP
jgi:hypothetical protein